MKQLAIYTMTHKNNDFLNPAARCYFFESIVRLITGLLRPAFCRARNDGNGLLRTAVSLFRDLKSLSIVLIFLTAPLYAQTFGALLEELSDGEGEQVESEMPAGLEGEPIENEGVSEPEGVSVYVPPPPPPKEEAKPLIPSSNDIQAAELENPLEEDDFAPVKNIVTNGVTLQGLDKQTARVFIIDAHVGQTIEFGTLKILVQHCEKAPLENRQESMAFVRITEQKANSDPQNLFSGWMLSSSPALSALDHPVYDVWVKECKVLE